MRMPSSTKADALFLLDTSAILAYLLNEPQASRVAAFHPKAVLPFIALSELYAALWLKFGQDKADEAVVTVQQWRRPWLWPTPESTLLAGRWRACYRLGLGDSFIAALAFTYGATLVTKDSDFRVLERELRLLYLA